MQPETAAIEGDPTRRHSSSIRRSGTTAERRGPAYRRVLFAVAALLVLCAACGSDSDGVDEANPDRPGPASGSVTQTTDEDGNFPQVSDPPRTGSLGTASVGVVEVATLDSPIALTGRAGSDVLYVAERAGRVRTVEVGADGAGEVADEPVLDISDEVSTEFERGLLGIAFSPDGKRLYTSSTNPDGDTRIAEYQMKGEVADPASRRELFAVDQPYPNHNGGHITFGPDGMLWLGLGDGGAGDDPENRAQDPANPLGKLLRLDPAKPDDADIWALGLRNPWRFSFDRETDDLWIGDVGQNAVEEIDFLPAGTAAGTNFGWSGYEGSERYIEDRVAADVVPPVFEMTHADGYCSVTGGVVYRGKAIADLVGAYLFGDYCKPGLHGLVLDDQGVVSDERALGVEVSQLVSIDEDNDGEVYLLSLEGTVSKLVDGS